MAKKVEKKTLRNSKGKKDAVSVIETPKSSFANLTRGEMLARCKANVAERKRLAEENKELYRLYKTSKAQEKTSSTEAKIQALTAQLEALKNPESK
jgi:hypothetical protein